MLEVIFEATYSTFIVAHGHTYLSGERPEYQQLLSPEKWQVVAHSLAHMTFMTRLNTILNNQDTNEQGPIDESQVIIQTNFSTDESWRKVKTMESLAFCTIFFILIVNIVL